MLESAITVGVLVLLGIVSTIIVLILVVGYKLFNEQY